MGTALEGAEDAMNVEEGKRQSVEDKARETENARKRERERE